MYMYLIDLLLIVLAAAIAWCSLYYMKQSKK